MFQNQSMMNSAQQLPIYVRIDGDKIINISTSVQNGQLLGYTTKAYEDAVKLAEDYEKLLIEHNIIQKEKTPEERMQDLSQKMEAILSSLNGINKRVMALEGMTTKQEAGTDEA